LELVTDEEITSKDIRNPVGEPGEGVGVTEACRGTLWHHDKLNEEGLAEKVNLIVATVQNVPSICMSVKNAAKGLIHGGKVSEGLLNMVEMAFRAYDPCFGCATHFAVGQMPLEVKIFNQEREILKVLKRP
jgi:F420-non-reducing hydrogenase large subunit